MALLGERRQFSDDHTHRRRASTQIPQCHEQQNAFVMRNLRQDNRPFLDTIPILLNLTFRMFVHIYFQKYNRFGFCEAIYITTIGVWNLDRDDLQ